MSGVYIKGMKMPKNGDTVIILQSSGVAVPTDGFVYDAFAVPDHGDLIDREALMPKGEEKGLRLMAIGIENIVNAPTVIPAERSEE